MDLQIFPSRDTSYVALQGRLERRPVNVRVLSIAIDDLDAFSPGTPTEEQRTAFVRHNREAVGAIVERKIAAGEIVDENWYGRDAVGVRVTGADFEEYLQHPGNELSYAAFDPRVRPGFGAQGRF